MNPKDSSWTRLQSTFDACRRAPIANKRPSQRPAFGRTKVPPNQSAVRLKPVPRRSAGTSAVFADAAPNRTPVKKRKPNSFSSPRNKENSASNATAYISDGDSIDFDPDHDGFLPDGGFCRTPKLSAAKCRLSVHTEIITKSTLPTVCTAAKTPRLDFTNILASFADAEVPSSLAADEDIEIPETQLPASEPFQIDDADTEDIAAGRIDDEDTTTTTTTSTDTASIASFASVAPASQRRQQHSHGDLAPSPLLLLVDSQASSSSSSVVPSAPHKPSPKRLRRRPRPGGLLDQLDVCVNRAKSNAAFWQHERRTGLVEPGIAVRVLELVPAVPDLGGGCWVRVRELHANDGDGSGDGDEELVLVIEGDLKLCARLLVGQRLEVDLRTATRLQVRLGRATAPVTVYPNVQFVREMPD